MTMLGGLKTDSGKNRIVPIHSRISSIILRYYDKNNKYLFVDEDGDKIEYKAYLSCFKKFKKENKDNFDINHVTHETRHSALADMDRYGANKKCRDMIMRTQV